MKKILVIVICVLFISIPIFANGLPTKEEGNGSGMVRIDENSSIRLVEESIQYTIKDEGFRGQYKLGLNNEVSRYISAEITVTYKMTSELAEETTMYFILPETDTGYISVDGDNIDQLIYTEPLPESIDWQPSSVQDYTTRDREFHTAQIPLKFEAGQEQTLVIHYIPSASFSRSGQYVNDIFDLLYYMTPADYWLGEPRVHLQVAVDENLSLESNIKLKKISDTLYEVDLDKLPHEEWSLRISHKNYRVFMTNNAWLHNGILLTLFYVAYRFLPRLIKAWSPIRVKRLTYITGSLAWFFLNVDPIGYPFGIFFVWAGYLIMYVIVPYRLNTKR